MINLAEVKEKYVCGFQGVIHIGAHEAEEYKIYKDLNIKPIIFFEPMEYSFNSILYHTKGDPDVKAYQYALGSENIKKQMFCANNRASSSFLAPKVHLEQYPGIQFFSSDIMEIKTLDSFNFTECNFLNIDVQGFEMEVLKGALHTLQYINYIILEVNSVEMYEGCALFPDIDKFLSEKGFEFKEADWKMGENNWGDALYTRK